MSVVALSTAGTSIYGVKFPAESCFRGSLFRWSGKGGVAAAIVAATAAAATVAGVTKRSGSKCDDTRRSSDLFYDALQRWAAGAYCHWNLSFYT